MNAESTRYHLPLIGLALALLASLGQTARCEDRGETTIPKVSVLLEDGEDVSDWYNGSPEETTVSSNDRFAKQATRALKFANIVDHTTGEKNYPVGWPRTGKDLAKEGLSDWSKFDFFECWIYVESSRDALPKTPLSVGFYHSGPKRSTSVPLTQVRLNEWAKITIPASQLTRPDDVQRVQFNISESNYQHGDRVDFYIDDLQLTRFAHPVIAELRAARQILFANDRTVIANYRLMGYRGDENLQAQLSVGQDNRVLASATQAIDDLREVSLAVDRWPRPGDYQATLRLLNEAGEVISTRNETFRVVDGPFADDQ